MTTEIQAFREIFNDAAENAERYAIFVRGREFQEESITKLERLLQEIKQKKEQAINSQREDDANGYLSFEYMATALRDELRFYIALKEDRPNEAWDLLINAQMAAANAMKAHEVANHLMRYINRLHALEKLLFPPTIFFSPGFLVQKSTCSICHAEYGECDHIKGRPYMGQLCARVVEKADLQEISAVAEPADKHCRALSFTEGNITRDIFSQRVIN